MPAKKSAAADKPNAADVKFLKNMIPHHEAALDMAKAELSRGADSRAKELARNVLKTQAAEIKRMKAILAESGKKPNKQMRGM